MTSFDGRAGGPSPRPGSAAEPGPRGLRVALRAQHLVLAVVVAAVAHPLFVHYTGFESVSRLGAGLTYPGLAGYKPRRTPHKSYTHGIDFSQIWFSARKRARGQEVYFPVERKRFRREWSSVYHPLIHWLYIPICELPFATALVVHNLLGIALFLLCSALALRRAGCGRALPTVAATSLALLYLTPTGLLHLERGQMDLYVASSFLAVWVLFGAGAGGERRWALAAALLSTLKVSAWGFVGPYWAAACALCGFRRPGTWLLPGAIAAVNLVLLGEVLSWLPTVRYVAGDWSDVGPTFARVLPRSLAEVLPLLGAGLLAGTGLLALRKAGAAGSAEGPARFRRLSFPFACALAVQAVCATPVTHDYRLVALLGLVPALAIWCAQEDALARWVRNGVCTAFGVLLLLAMRVRPFTGLSPTELAGALLLLSALFLAIALYLALAGGRASEASSS